MVVLIGGAVLLPRSIIFKIFYANVRFLKSEEGTDVNTEYSPKAKF